MKVICNTNTTKLVKGATYDVVLISNATSTRPNFIIKVGDHNYRTSIKSFTNLDGTPIINDYKSNKEEVVEDYRLRLNDKDMKDLKKGDYVVAMSSSKTIERGRMYIVSEVHFVEKQFTRSWSTNTYTKTEAKLKVNGYGGWLSPYRFRKLSVQESRDIALSSVMDEDVKVDRANVDRRIDRQNEDRKRQMVLGCLFSAIMDPYRNNMSVLEWAVKRTGKKYSINEEDLKPYLNMKLSQIVKSLDV